MVATRELAEAQAWSRRRLAHVLVAGPEGVRGQEPRRPGRALVGGAVVALLLLGGVGAAGLVRAHSAGPGAVAAPALRPGVAVAAETGAVYVVLDAGAAGPTAEPTAADLLARPVLNPTSARLLLPDGGTGAGPPQAAPASVLAQLAARAPGPAVGIPDAPAVVPAAGSLLTGGWSSCPEAPVPVLPAEPPGPLGAGTAVLVTAGGAAQLVVDAGDGARRYPLPADPAAAEARLASLGVPPLATAAPVPPAWLALVPPGTSATLPPLAVRTGPTCLLLAPAAAVRLTVPPGAGTPPGAGALVSTPEQPRARWFVDDRGRALAVLGAEALARLGWADVEPVVVPVSWLALLEPGPTLSVPAAATPVASLRQAGTAAAAGVGVGVGCRSGAPCE